jgi:hypothetical protein
MEGKPPQVTEAAFLLGRLFSGGADCTKNLILLFSEESHFQKFLICRCDCG